ncbi:MAG: PG0541 family transporter-associated protein [Candidatus Oleimicrobiaceae bacterium]
MEKMLILIYNNALERVVLKYIDDCQVSCFTLIPKVFGRGESGGPRLGTAVWPGENAMLLIVDSEERIGALLQRARKLKARHHGKGIKAFVLPVEAKL